MAHVRPEYNTHYPKSKTKENVINRLNYSENNKILVEKKAVLWYNSGKKTYREEHHEAAFFF